MASGAEGLRATSPEFAVETWHSLQAQQQSIDGLNRHLGELGYAKVHKSSFYRWLKKPSINSRVDRIPRVITRRAAAQEPTPLPAVVLPPGALPDLSGIPQDMVEALGLRVLLVAKGTGLDRVEDAIALVATAIAKKADAIADQLLATERESETVTKDGETVSSKTVEAANAARNAVNALSICADAMHRITAARTLPSLAHRNYAEGDRLSGEGEKFRAEAEVTRNAGRADSAKVINNDGRPYDAEAEDEAIAAMRDVEGRK